jgi:mannose-6-phosphate isomerase
MTFSGPICFAPWLRPMPWGGDHLAQLLELPATGAPIGEAWLLSDHALHQSQVKDGPWAGQTLRSLLRQHGQALLGKKCERFPLLIKLLDARENLSVQVHPDDESARQWAPHEGGKTEAWTVLASEPEGAIYLGLKRGMDKQVLARELLTGNAAACLERVAPRAGETYFVPAGTVHALGQGVMVLEVQQTSDATFRLYDWGRVDPDGRPRALHLEAGLACTRERPTRAGLQQPIRTPDGAELLVQSPYFRIRRLPKQGRVSILAPALVLLWQGTADWCDGGALKRGEIALVPACLGSLELNAGSDAEVFEIQWCDDARA